jgi:alpha-tubulin suppressor-like RCC1 family protein
LGDNIDRLTPTLIPNFKFKSIVAGYEHTVALDFNNYVWINFPCGKNPIVVVRTFGGNEYGQLGLGNRRHRLAPTKIHDFKCKSVSAGAEHTMALDFNGDVWGCGSNKLGQLGIGYKQDGLEPTKIENFKAKYVIAGGLHTIALSYYDLKENGLQ